MIDQALLTADLRKLVEKDLLPSLRKRAAAVSSIDQALRAEHRTAKEARRTGFAFEVWLDDYLTQVGVAWVLGCVFVRFMEDNGLVDAKDNFPRIAGAGPALRQAQDQHEAYFKAHPTHSDRDYLLADFADAGKLRGCHELFSKAHNPLWAQDGVLMDADAASRLIAFFQQLRDDSEKAELVHDFTDEALGTRFLGDLYQNLSEAARKKYALLQTPVFVEEFILDRTLEPAIKEFGLCDIQGRELSAQKKPIPSDHLLRLIDPTVGSGHFLLGAFDRLFAHWQRQEPMTEPAVLAERCLNSLFGVDLNPYAANIARFRLLVAALKACGIKRLREARDFRVNIAVGDSLLHGSFAGGAAGGELFEAQVRTDTGNQYATSAEDLNVLRRFLMPHRYHVVVGNPPYIAVKDAALSEAYRRRYGSCHGKYALSVPFFERFMDLAVTPGSAEPSKAGFVGKITANSFMKRGFGKKLIEIFLPRWDLTHVVDISLAYIPGHGTPTVILLGRHRTPMTKSIRLVGAIKREDAEPNPPESGRVWVSILNQIDRPGSTSEFVSVSDTLRENFHKHPWSIGGGGAAELKEALDLYVEDGVGTILADIADSIGITSFTLADDLFYLPNGALMRRRIPRAQVREMVVGEAIRHWQIAHCETVIFPYDARFTPIAPDASHAALRSLWPARTLLSNNKMFAGRTKVECGLRWYEYGRLTSHKLLTPLSLTFANVATHNHFVLDRGGRIFECHAPIVKLAAAATEGEHLSLAGLLNSATGQFWMKQVFHDKGGGGIGGGIAAESWERFLEYDGTKLLQFPVPCAAPVNATPETIRAAVTTLARDIDTLAQARAKMLPSALVGSRQNAVITRAELDAAKLKAADLLQQMIANQEELDWLVYRAYGLLEDTKAECADPPHISLGERAFEIAMARKMTAGTFNTEWFNRHGSTPITQIHAHWHAAYKKVVEHRIALIEAGPEQNKDIALIEQPEYKRRWNTEPWVEMEERALREWLLDRLEWGTKTPSAETTAGSRSSVWDEREPRLITAARLADKMRGDEAFRCVAMLYAKSHGGVDDLTAIVSELVEAESVPFLPVLRYKESGLTKRRVWERTWDLQREEDRLEALREIVRAQLKSAEEAIIVRSLSKEREAIDTLTAQLAQDRNTLTAKFLVGIDFDESVRPEKLASKLNRDAEPACRTLVDTITTIAEKLSETESGFRRRLAELKREDRAWNAAVEELEAIPPNPEIDVPPRYKPADFFPGPFWRLRGKLDVPKERFVSFPHCGPDGDASLLITWAGFDHRQQARAITTYYMDKKANAGWDKSRFVPLLAGLLELLTWLKQWYNDRDQDGHNWAEVIEGFIADEARELGQMAEQIKAWTPPQAVRRNGRAGRRKKKAKAEPTLLGLDKGND